MTLYVITPLRLEQMFLYSPLSGSAMTFIPQYVILFILYLASRELEMRVEVLQTVKFCRSKQITVLI